MVFSGLPFLYIFLPAVLLVYSATPRRYKNAVLLLASLLFYFCGEPRYTWLLIVSSLSDYFHSLLIEKYRGTKTAKLLLISSIVINLLMLGFFKYVDFFITVGNELFRTNMPLLNVPLPIGISFFTFQTMSYTIDVYRGRVRANRNFTTFATFVCLFPQLVAGPIVRYADIEAELSADRRFSASDMSSGIWRFVIGLLKKVLIANAMGELITAFRASDEKTMLFYWIYAFAFAFQVYFDFSGYSDMAIGLGKIFGFNFPENFNYPFISKSATEFWRRWHMTLGGWFRDYVYIPMGGNRVPWWRWVFNIFTVWFLTGFWHGAAWNFIVWGLLFGVLLALEKLFLSKQLERIGAVAQHAYLIFVILISFVIFNGDGMRGALLDLFGLFGLGVKGIWNQESLFYLRDYAVLFVVAALGSTPLLKRLAEKLSIGRGKVLLTVAEPLALVVFMVIVTANLVDGSFNPFLYFRF